MLFLHRKILCILCCAKYSQKLWEIRESQKWSYIYSKVYQLALSQEPLLKYLHVQTGRTFSIAKKILKYRIMVIFIIVFIIYPLIYKFPKHWIYQVLTSFHTYIKIISIWLQLWFNSTKETGNWEKSFYSINNLFLEKFWRIAIFLIC